MSKVFRFYPGRTCPICGSAIEILTDHDCPPGTAFDCDTIMCTRCSTIGVFDGAKKEIIWTIREHKKESVLFSCLFYAMLILIGVAFISY